MDFLMNQQSIMLNGNCQLIPCTHITYTDLLSNLKGLLDSMIIKYFYCDATLLVMNISYFPYLHYWLPLLENLGTVKLSCLKHCQRLFVDIIFSRNFMP